MKSRHYPQHNDTPPARGDTKPGIAGAPIKWWHQILFVAVGCAMVLPAISWYIHHEHERAMYSVADTRPQPKTPEPEVYRGKIDLKTGDVKIVKY